MKLSLTVLSLVLLAPTAFAQKSTLPYATGSGEQFLKANQAKKVPSVVLYNFNLDSG